ncbi:MAG: Nif11-like leader peptide family natural product precursor [Rubrivivax sp.]
MTSQSASGFRQAVGASQELQKQVQAALSKGDIAGLVAVGKKNGYDFSEAEAKATIAEVSKGGKLNDFELEMVSGGVDPVNRSGTVTTPGK